MLRYYQQFKILPDQKVLSIGCGGGLWEVIMTHYIPIEHITLVDFNEHILNETLLQETIIYFEKQFKKSNNCQYKIINIDAHLLNLSVHSIDHILFINSLHEIENSTVLLQQCKNFLSPHGSIWVEEEIANKPNTLHQGCGKRLWMSQDIILMAQKNGLQLRKKSIDNKNTLFCFKNK